MQNPFQQQRLAQKYSRVKFALKYGLSVATLSNIEGGAARTMRDDTAARLALAFDTSVEEIKKTYAAWRAGELLAA